MRYIFFLLIFLLSTVVCASEIVDMEIKKEEGWLANVTIWCQFANGPLACKPINIGGKWQTLDNSFNIDFSTRDELSYEYFEYIVNNYLPQRIEWCGGYYENPILDYSNECMMMAMACGNYKEGQVYANVFYQWHLVDDSLLPRYTSEKDSW